MSPLVIFLLAVLFVSGTGLIVFIMLHSGKGTGISDAIAASMYNSQSSTGLIEKNLDRITIIFGVIFFIDLLLLMVFFPLGHIALG